MQKIYSPAKLPGCSTQKFLRERATETQAQEVFQSYHRLAQSVRVWCARETRYIAGQVVGAVVTYANIGFIDPRTGVSVVVSTISSRSPKFLLWAVLASGLVASGAQSSGDKITEEMILTSQTGATREDTEIRHWQDRAGTPQATSADFDRLGWAFVAKARRTLDGGYYTLAEKTAAVSEARFGVSAESRLLRGHVFHNEHRFKEAEQLARALVAERGSPEDWALLSDALMEQGQLAEAVAALQKMVDLKPGIEAYSRIAQMRWLKGDLSGAIAAMEAAVRATSSRAAETSAWALARLSGFYLQNGQTARAGETASAATRLAPDFPPALLAAGRACLAAGKGAEGISALQQAVALNPLPEYQWWLADALAVAGRTSDASKVESELRRRGAASDPRTFALFLATRHEEPPTAVLLARTELENRADVLSHDALAWAFAANGDYAAAEPEMRAALAEQTHDARLYLHAGEIMQARGRGEEAAKFFAEAKPLAGTLTPAEGALLASRLSAAVVKAERISKSETKSENQ